MLCHVLFCSIKGKSTRAKTRAKREQNARNMRVFPPADYTAPAPFSPSLMDNCALTVRLKASKRDRLSTKWFRRDIGIEYLSHRVLTTFITRKWIHPFESRRGSRDIFLTPPLISIRLQGSGLQKARLPFVLSSNALLRSHLSIYISTYLSAGHLSRQTLALRTHS